MCEQTEINYLDEDVVWVKLGACWWPGQVTGLHNLPEDIQTEFQKKPLIAVVKFFQEDTYEFVKNYQQIYKYNCTLKDEFIRKGLDKYRSKSKDGASYMDKFPDDVEMAEKLTGGDPAILRQEKFCPEEKPDISALFGEKKLPKKKRDREDRRSDGTDMVRKITHPRFLRGESDHEIRIRQQSNLPSTPSAGSPQYACHLCSFTSSRINVIICHIKSHRSGDSPPTPRSRIKTYSQSHARISNMSTPKRKYIRKDKSQSSRKKSESKLDLGKRKHPKQTDKANKKKKSDPELREKLLADWDDESDEETSLNVNNSLNSSLNSSPIKNQLSVDDNDKQLNEENDATTDNNEIIAETEKLLKETEELSSIHTMEESLDSMHTSKNLRSSTFDKKSESEKNVKTDGASNEAFNKTQKKDISNSDNEVKNVSDKDDKKSRLSCFDFDEDDLSEPSIPPVRKIPRVFGEKSLSLKKEIIKEFEMSQALKNEIKKDADKISELDRSMELKADEIIEIIQGSDHLQKKKETKANEKLDESQVEDNKMEIKQSEDKTEKKNVPSEDDKAKSNACETEVEIVEIFEVEREDGGDKDRTVNVVKDIGKRSKTAASACNDKASEEKIEVPVDVAKASDNKLLQSEKALEIAVAEPNENAFMKEADDTLSERFTTETEDETVSESAETMPEQSENSDIDMLDKDRSANNSLTEKRVGQTTMKRGRGRPRKNAKSVSKGDNVSKNSKARMGRGSKRFRMSEKIEVERKTSDSDTDRSYSGRRRKPNKKYLESDIYVQEPDYKAFRTDESQSESDDKIPEKITSRSRRGRRPKGGVESRSSDLVTQIDREEIEIAEQTPTVAENNVNILATDTRHETSDNALKEKTSSKKLEEKSEETKRDALEKPLDEIGTAKVNIKAPSENVDASTLTEFTSKTNEVELDSDKAVEKSPEADEDKKVKPAKDVEEDVKNEEKSTVVQQAEDTLDKVEMQRDTAKASVDMLPPKKSQIKKFELSQIDFSDANAPANKTVGVESASEARVEHPEPEHRSSGNDTKEKRNKENEKVAVKATMDKITDEIAEILGENQQEQILKSAEIQPQEKLEKLEEKMKEMPSAEEVSRKMENINNRPEFKTPEKSSKVDSAQDTLKKTTIEQPLTPKRSSMQTRYKGRFTPETGVKGKKDKDLLLEEKPINTFQEAFLKTLQMDKKKIMVEDVEMTKGKKGRKSIKKKTEEIETADATIAASAQAVKAADESKNSGVSENIQIEGNVLRMPVVSGLENVKIIVEEKLEVDAKIGDTALKTTGQFGSSPGEFVVASKSSLQASVSENNAKGTLDVKKLEEIPKMSLPMTSSLSISSDISVPVKKREMPRIIENVTLTEPVQILKTKLLDKLPQKGVKHKLEADVTKRIDSKGSPKAKIMKIETLPSNSKAKAGTKSSPTGSPHMSLTRKLQVLKTEETDALLEVQNEKQAAPTTQTLVTTEKYIQQSSQSLADMELDINSMPFVLSEDVLTPENIEQIPVVISSIIPESSSMSATATLTPTTQTAQFKIASEIAPETVSSSTKKKSGVPAILKNKKARPTITSVKTLVPPLTGGVKGLKFQSAQPASKTSPLLTQKAATSGKYVVVQTAGGQQLRYSVQGKSGTPQKIAIPTGKPTAGNAQVVQQGGKVVILTSAQSCQAKMVPLNISKTLGGKVQRIVTTSKGQVLCPINPQGGIITSKTIIAPKTDAAGSPTTSKLAAAAGGHKIINTQGIITSKGVLTPITGTITKTALLGTLSQGILTKGGIYTPISASALSGKTIIGSKTLVTKGATLLSPQSLSGAKAILTPVSQTIAGKTTILSTQTIVGRQGTVLTPITGQQVKAIVAKSPTKGGKVSYQPVQQKMQLQPILQKSPKVSSMSSTSSQAKTATLKSPGGTLILQNTAANTTTPQKSAAPHGKKVIKQQTVMQSATAAVQGIVSPSGAPQTMTMIPQVQSSKGGKAATVSKVVIPRSGGRQTKAQQKIVVQKMQEPAASMQAAHAKQTVASSVNMPMTTKTTVVQQQSKQATARSSTKSSHALSKAQAQKNLLNVAMNSMSGVTTGGNIVTTLALPPLEPIDAERKTKADSQLVNAGQKEQAENVQCEKSGNAKPRAEEPRVAVAAAAQPQIMALPTESSDGTQTYVLVTIDEQGQIQPLDNNTLMSLEGTTQNPDGTRTLYIDPSSLGETGTLDNIVLQFDNGILPNIQTSATTEPSQTIISESFPTSEVIQTSNQDILAAALANTDFQQEISLPDNQAASVMTAGLTQTSLINQTILQSTIIPPTEPISSPSVLETSLTLNQPIMTPLEVPSNLPIQSDSASTSASTVVSTIPSSLELPITITNPSISYISAGEAQIQIPGNSMPDIGEIMESPAASGAMSRPEEIPVSTQYLVIPNLEDNIATVEPQSVQSTEIAVAPVSYSVSVPSNVVLDSPQVQTTPSMPIIDDTYADSAQFAATSIATEQAFVDVPVSEMLASKAPSVPVESVQSQEITVMSEMIVPAHQVPISPRKAVMTTDESKSSSEGQVATMQEVYSSQEVPITPGKLSLQQSMKEANASSSSTMEVTKEAVADDKESGAPITGCLPLIDETTLVTSESNSRIESVEQVGFQVTDSSKLKSAGSHEEETDTADKLKQLTFSEGPSNKVNLMINQQVITASSEVEATSQVLPADPSLNPSSDATTMEMDEEETLESEKFYAGTTKRSADCQRDEPSSQVESDGRCSRKSVELHSVEEEKMSTEATSQETPSQSYEQFNSAPVTSDSADLPSQSAAKSSESTAEATQSIAYEPMETDEEEAVMAEPPTQSFEHSKINEASQSYETSAEANVNAPTQSFNEIMQSQEDRSCADEAIDDQSFPTQSYEVDKGESVPENLETDAEISQEGNVPSQSNDIGADGIGTSSVSTNNSGLNEDETASSSYVPETPENQERDQEDQESAISTSSYEIPPCEELNIASSSVIPDTSVSAEHSSIHDNGVPEIPTSSYNLNPDITSTHVDSGPTSSYEDHVIVEQNVSTSYDVPISMPGLDETCSQNFVTESTDHRNEPSSYYAHHQEVTPSYYESVDQDTKSRLEGGDPHEEVTPGYYEGNPQEVSQSYFAPAEETPSYTSHSISPSYYDPRPEGEASQSYYSTDDLDKTEQSSSPNIEASQSYYQERSGELRLRQQGEATPTYSEGYPVDYMLENSPIERHDLVESSVPATKPMER